MVPPDRPGTDGPDATATDLAWLRRRPPVDIGESRDADAWLVSYSDLVTLLFAVFVMLLAITMVRDRAPSAADPPPQPRSPASLAPASAGPALPSGTVEAYPAADAAPAPDAPGAAAPPAALQEALAVMAVPPGVVVRVRPDRVELEFSDAILFGSGHADLSEPGLAVLARLVPVFTAVPVDLVVAGHTDDVPIASSRFPSNWELSAARAAAVVRALIAEGVPAARFSIAAHADTRPLAAADDAASRARNRRVTITARLPQPGTEPLPP